MWPWNGIDHANWIPRVPDNIVAAAQWMGLPVWGTSIAQAQWESETYCQNCAGYAQLGQWCWNDTECCSGYCETPARRDQGRSGPGERTVVGARTG
jgi:hypothetical protein